MRVFNSTSSVSSDTRGDGVPSSFRRVSWLDQMGIWFVQLGFAALALAVLYWALRESPSSREAAHRSSVSDQFPEAAEAWDAMDDRRREHRIIPASELRLVDLEPTVDLLPPVPGPQQLMIPPPVPPPLPLDAMTNTLGPVVSGPTFVLRFQAVPWDLVLRRFAREAGLSLQMDVVPSGTFNYSDEVPKSAAEALDILNDQLLQQGVLLVRRERSAAVVDARKKVPDAFIPQVISSDLPRLGRNELASLVLNIPDGAAATVAKEVESLLTPLGSVLPLTNSQRLLITDFGGNLRRIHELLLSNSTARRPSYVYRLKNTAATEVAAAVGELLTGRISPLKGPNGGNAIQPTVYQPPSGGGDPLAVQVVPEPTTNSILLCGPQSDIDEACRLISQLDMCPPQVMIQALLVEVELGNTDEFGIELGVQDSVLFDRSVINNLVTLTQTNTNPNGVQTSSQQVLSQTSEPGFNFNNKPLGNNTSVQPSKVGSQALSNLAVGRINGDLGYGGLVLSAGSESINVLIRALAARYKVDVLSRPQITTLDNQPAHIQIGQQVPVVDGVTISPVGSANPVVRQDQAGIILKVTPRVGPDGIVINVTAEKSQYQLTPGTGVPIFTDGTNGNVIEAPIKDLTTVQTMVGIKDGQCIVLGGMITKSLQIVERKVPVLGDVPYLGMLFRYDMEQQKRKELLIFLTPHVIETPLQTEELKEQELSRVNFPYGDAEQIHGPMLRPPSELPVGIVPLTEADFKTPTPVKTKRRLRLPWSSQPAAAPVALPPEVLLQPPTPVNAVVPASAATVFPATPSAPQRLLPGAAPQPALPARSANPYTSNYRIGR